MRSGQRESLRRGAHRNGMGRAGCHAFATTSTARFCDSWLGGTALAQGETNGAFPTMIFTGTAQHTLMGQTSRANRGPERPGGKIGGNKRKRGRRRCALPKFFRAGFHAIRAKRAMRPPKINFWKPPRPLFEQPGRARCHASVTTATGLREKRLLHCPGRTVRNRRTLA